MEKKQNVARKVVAELSLQAAKNSVNRGCPAFFYQPQIPESLKKFKKH